MTTTENEKPTREAEIKACKQVVATVERATQNKLADEFVDLFRADAIWATGGGKGPFGRDEPRGSPGRCCPQG